MQLRLGRFKEVGEFKPSQILLNQEGFALPSPVAAFPGQDLGSLMGGMQAASLTVRDLVPLVPTLEWKLLTIPDGTFFVGHQLDGVIVTQDGSPIHQTAAFRGLKEAGAAEETVLDVPESYQLEEVFVGFDGAWRNYFHWMCFGLTKSFLAARVLDPSVVIAVPDYRSGLRTGPISFSETTWQQSLEFSGLSDRVTLLPQGAYRARKIHFFWTSPSAPTDIMYLHAFKDVFDTMAEHAIPTSKEFESVYLARARSVSNRLASGSGDILARVLDRRGFRTVGFEGADLQQQISIFANAKRVVSPHGAGLTNTLFHRGGLRVLEVNKALDGGQAFRPWFYVTSAIRHHRYATLDSAMPDFAEEHVESAIAALDA